MTHKLFSGGVPRRACPAVAGLALACGIWTGAAMAADSAVVFMYHRFGETTHLSTNIRIGQFESHIAELKSTSEKYIVKPLPEIVAALRAGRELPDRTVAITIDDAFISVYTRAWPRLKAAGLPFTLFVATAPVNQEKSGYMSWEQIAELAASGLVTIGGHTVTHLHMAASSASRNAAELAKSNATFKDKLGSVPELFAYPYGEYSLAVQKALKDAGHNSGFGQHSGVVHSGGDFFFMPRFAMNETYAYIARFRRTAQALPLPLKEVTPADPLLGPGNNPPPFGFTLMGDAIKGISRLNCYTAGQGRAQIERLGKSRVEVRVAKAFPPGRTRINCTMPASGKRWRWFGMQFYVRKKR